MFFQIKACLERTDNDYYSAPCDFKVQTNWEKIKSAAENKFNGQVVNECSFVFNTKEDLDKFWACFILWYTNIPLNQLIDLCSF